MIKFDIITIFPEIFESYFKQGLIAKAQKKRLIKISIHDLRRWTKDKHKSVDDRPFGGGWGMVLKVEPIYKAVKQIKSGPVDQSMGPEKKSRVVLFTPRGKKFNQRIANQLSRLDQVIMICGRYEGVDERVAKHIADLDLSIGDYDLMGGELPAMVLVETVSRLIPGVIGKRELLKERINKKGGFTEYAQYTRPEVFSPKKGVNWKVPKVLVSGNHKEIGAWKKKHSKVIEK